MNKKVFSINPVLVREMKVKMRTWKAPLLICFYDMVLILLVITLMNMGVVDSLGRISEESIVTVYLFMIAIQCTLIALIAPALTAGCISGEREKQTLDILLSTTMKHGSIVVGKLFASLSQMILLIVSSLPIFSIVFLYGSIGAREIMELFIYYIITAVLMGSIGVFFSTFTQRSTVATVMSYIFILFICFGTILISMAYVRILLMPQGNKFGPYEHNYWLMYFSPAAGWGSLMSAQLGEGVTNRIYGLYLNGKHTGILLWHINAMLDMLISALLLWLSALRINPARTRLFQLKSRK
ncbi:ABC transporter permease [Clostridium oryzae]|uniref:ABC-2 family transporter protein n=1 Tax=Clostridium oryzae TaxID=1450648 RepID=A0A1V4ITE7_9CLOT|nr:ABC transporter permease subunit [Clostridium oryzae]OPJ63075.1 ABC-2 family transporter protein [Clostridium oryzae]